MKSKYDKILALMFLTGLAFTSGFLLAAGCCVEEPATAVLFVAVSAALLAVSITGPFAWVSK